MKKIAYIFNAGGLGDSVMCLPALYYIKELAEEVYIVTHSPIFEIVYKNEPKFKFIYTKILQAKNIR